VHFILLFKEDHGAIDILMPQTPVPQVPLPPLPPLPPLLPTATEHAALHVLGTASADVPVSTSCVFT